MKELIVLFAIVAVSLAGTCSSCNSYEAEKVNEGHEKCVYNDPLGIPTIGVGFNLKKDGAREAIEGVGADYDNVLSGSQCLNEKQVKTLFDNDMNEANSCAKNWLGSSWSDLGSDPQSAVADMAFNVGCGTLHEFKKLHAALTESPPNYEAARNEMQDSKWCGQVPNRCSRNVECMKKE